MATEADPKRVAHLRERIAKEPEFVAAINELWWPLATRSLAELALHSWFCLGSLFRHAGLFRKR